MIKISQKKGTAVIITFLILITLLILGCYFLTFALTESRISKSQGAGARAYYLAEAGINEAIWKLQNDLSWASDFIDCDNKNPDPTGEYWTAEFIRPFDDGSSYTVKIQNSACGQGEIVSTSRYPLAEERSAQRVVKTGVFRALGSLTENSAFFTGGASENVKITSSQITIYDGNLYCGNVLDIKKDSIVEVYDNLDTEDNPDTENIVENLEGQVLVEGNLNISSDSTLDDCEVKCAANICEACPSKSYSCADVGIDDCSSFTGGDIPGVDFDSDSKNSFKSRAQTAQNLGQCEILCNGIPCATDCIYSVSDFEDLLWQVGEGGILTLNPNNRPNIIFYVAGPGGIKLDGSRHLVIKGTLVADGNIDIGKQGESSQVVINQPLDSPSGLLAQGKINFSYTDFNITGVIYALEAITIRNAQGTFNIQGCVIARKISLESIGQLNITLDNDIIRYGLGYKIDSDLITPQFSPTITIDHWEESY